MTSTEISPGLFATRWITHSVHRCSCLLAGTSAGLMTARRSPGELTRFLFTRGLGWSSSSDSWIGDGFHLRPRGWPSGRPGAGPPAGHLGHRRRMIVPRPGAAAGRPSVWRPHRNRRPAQPARPIWPLSQQFDQGLPLWVALHGQMAVPVGPFLLLFVYPLLPWIGCDAARARYRRRIRTPSGRSSGMLLRGGRRPDGAFVVLRASPLRRPDPWQVQRPASPPPSSTFSTPQNTHRAWHSC